MIVDFSTHLISPEVGKILMKKPFYAPSSGIQGKYQVRYPPEQADPKIRINLMERYNIDMQLLSQTTPVLLGFDKEEAKRICRLSNDSIAELCSKHPDRFIGCAIVSLLDVEGALEELDRTVEELDFRCVTISTNQNGKGLDSSEYYPFYERVVKHDIPIFLQPTNWEGYPLADVETGNLMGVFGWPFDTTQAVWRLIFGGVLDMFPTLKVVTHHLGGMLPYYKNRAISYSRLPERLTRSITSYFEQIYGDTAINGGPIESLVCGYSFFGSDRILFGSDYPFGQESSIIRDNIECIKNMPIPQKEKEKLLGDNAKRILRIL